MNLKELLEKRAALLAELNKTETTAERFAEIRAAVDKLNYQIEQIKKDDAGKESRRITRRKTSERNARRPKESKGRRNAQGAIRRTRKTCRKP